jgi:excisionase family DNA binding protein
MSSRLDAAVAELAAAIRQEVRDELRSGDGPPVLLSVDQAAQRTGIGRTSIYQAMASGQLRSLRIGRRRLIAVDALADLIHNSGTPGEEAAPDAPATGGTRHAPPPAV